MSSCDAPCFLSGRLISQRLGERSPVRLPRFDHACGWLIAISSALAVPSGDLFLLLFKRKHPRQGTNSKSNPELQEQMAVCSGLPGHTLITSYGIRQLGCEPTGAGKMSLRHRKKALDIVLLLSSTCVA